MVGEGFDKVIYVAVHGGRDIGTRIMDAVIGDAVLGEVVGADFFATITGADERFTGGGILGEFFFALFFSEAGA